MASTWNETQLQLLPNLVPLEDTIFSFSNITASLLLLFVVPTVLFFVAKKANTSIPQIKLYASVSAEKHIAKGAERADHSPYFGRFFGLMLLAFSILQINNASGLSFLTPNYLNGVLLALALLLHKNIQSFLRALDAAIGDAAGILIQFPLYFGIMALMRDSGLVALMADYFATVATVESFPFFTFISAAIINVFVPSGGGQWAVQAPILIEASMQLGVPLSKSIMAMAYGDQLTNMMQPFWALPLLAITGLKAKDILPYSLLVMLVGFVVFFLVLMI
jgi:short-chain fatty acids transporter